MGLKKVLQIIVLLSALFMLAGCGDIIDLLLEDNEQTESNAGEGNKEVSPRGEVTPLADLTNTEIFQRGALEHILEGELNRKGAAVGFHYDRLPTKKGEIIDGSKTAEDDQGVYEAKVIVDGVEKTSNRGRSSFFPDAWDTQDVVDAIKEAYDSREFIQGNTYEGISANGIVIQMYVNGNDQIISAFPVYEGD